MSHKQWILFEGGLLCPNMDYPIDADRLFETRQASSAGGIFYDWPLHMAEKNWVDFAVFEDVFRAALKGLERHYDQSLMDKSFAEARRERLRDYGTLRAAG